MGWRGSSSCHVSCLVFALTHHKADSSVSFLALVVLSYYAIESDVQLNLNVIPPTLSLLFTSGLEYYGLTRQLYHPFIRISDPELLYIQFP